MAAIDLRIPLPGTPLADPAWEVFFNDLVDRTGAPDTDKVEQGITDAAAASAAASAAQSAADAAQGDATLALGEIQGLAEQNAAENKKARFLRHWYGS